MDSPTFSNETFENVKCITIHILVDGNIVLPDETESNTNAALFVEKLNQLFPNASVCQLENNGSYSQETQVVLNGQDQLIASLLVSRKEISYRLFGCDLALDNLPAITNLTAITYYECNDSDLFRQLIRINSSSLIKLYVEFKDQYLFKSLVIDSDEASIQYPNLKKLILWYHGLRHTGPRLQLEGVPFPALTSLEIAELGCIGNDILFRGNSQTLEYIRALFLVNDYSSIPFNEGNAQLTFPKAKQLIIDLYYIGEAAVPEHEHSITWFATDSAPNVQYLKLVPAYSLNKDILITKLCSSSAARHLVCLEICQLDLSMLEIIDILKHTPSLICLLLQLPELKYTLDCEQASNNLAELRKMHNIPNSKLSTFVIETSSDQKRTIHLGLILGLLCPSLSVVKWGSSPVFFEPAYNLVSNLPVYNKHKKRLQEIEWEEWDRSSMTWAYPE
ncbi:hypothetical protein GGF41_004971 [Coemansia sp. RSA 2531]|nr:hypothetical protein GGF41_004971 [Coemansia sp. RSA 2531]